MGEPLTFVVRSSTGAQPPFWIERGGELRWRVHSKDPSRFSASWKIWTSKNSPNAYVAQRALGDFMKLSIHESGQLQTSFINNAVSKEWQGEVEGGSRHLDVWEKRPEFAPGWIRHVEIVHPESELRSWDDPEPKTKDYIGLPINAERALFIYLCEVNVDTPISMGFADSFHIATFVLDEERRIVVMAVSQEWGQSTLIDRARRGEMPNQPADLKPPGKSSIQRHPVCATQCTAVTTTERVGRSIARAHCSIKSQVFPAGK